MALKLRQRDRDNLQTALRGLREHRKAGDNHRRAILKVLRSDEMLAELKRRVQEDFGINVDNLRALLDLFIEYAPKILAIILQIVAVF